MVSAPKSAWVWGAKKFVAIVLVLFSYKMVNHHSMQYKINLNGAKNSTSTMYLVKNND